MGNNRKESIGKDFITLRLRARPNGTTWRQQVLELPEFAV